MNHEETHARFAQGKDAWNAVDPRRVRRRFRGLFEFGALAVCRRPR